MRPVRRQIRRKTLEIVNHMLSILPSSPESFVPFYPMVVPIAAFSEGDPIQRLYREASSEFIPWALANDAVENAETDE